MPVPVAETEAPSEAEGVGVGVNEGEGQSNRRNVVASETYTKSPPALLATFPRILVENASCPTPRGPSAKPGAPTPAMVVTARVKSTTRRTRLLPTSATSKFPRLSSATEQGKLNLALVPEPSAKPALPPANVLTSPPPSKRTRWFDASAIKRLSPPPWSKDTPLGLEKRALVGAPSAKVHAVVLPASVATAPVAAINIRTVQPLPVSEKYKFPPPSLLKEPSRYEPILHTPMGPSTVEQQPVPYELEMPEAVTRRTPEKPPSKVHRLLLPSTLSAVG